MADAHDTPKDANRPSKQTYTEWAQAKYGEQYEAWWPWVEDNILKYFTKDNKASYATRDALNRTKVTGIKQADTLQDGVHNLVAGQVGQGGLLEPVGDLLSSQGVNRAERHGKDEHGGYLPAVPGMSKLTAVPGLGKLPAVPGLGR